MYVNLPKKIQGFQRYAQFFDSSRIEQVDFKTFLAIKNSTTRLAIFFYPYSTLDRKIKKNRLLYLIRSVPVRLRRLNHSEITVESVE